MYLVVVSIVILSYFLSTVQWPVSGESELDVSGNCQEGCFLSQVLSGLRVL